MAKKGAVLICDDEEIMRDVLETILSGAGYKVELAKTGEEAIELYTRRSFDLVLMDVSMPGMGGLTALEELIKLDAEAVVLIVTAYATFDTAISAWEKGATGVIRKPFQNEQILSLVAKGIKKRRKEEERQTLRQAMAKSVKREGFIGRSDVMENVFGLVERVAPARSTVLITGESGTGKELVAKAIHEASPRSGEQFVAVNCSNIPSELLESELFGHTKGAFTGAVTAKKGLFEVADGGSIFLDEIGDLRPEIQVRLLRVIQEREFTPLGDTNPVKVDVRIIAATNVDLKEAVRNGQFQRGPLLPPIGRADRVAAAPRPPRRHPAALAVLYSQICGRKWPKDLREPLARGPLLARKLQLPGECSGARKYYRTCDRDRTGRRDHARMPAGRGPRS